MDIKVTNEDLDKILKDAIRETIGKELTYSKVENIIKDQVQNKIVYADWDGILRTVAKQIIKDEVTKICEVVVKKEINRFLRENKEEIIHNASSEFAESVLEYLR